MPTGTCHCGAISFEVDLAPESINACQCSICRRYGVRWAYYAPSSVRLIAAEDALEDYRWGERSLAFHRCCRCGCVTHWSAQVGERDRMGVNANLFPPDALRGVACRVTPGPP